MATNVYSEQLRNAALNKIDLQKWFHQKGFIKESFEANKSKKYFSDVLHVIEENEGYDTYVKSDIGESLLGV